VCRSIANFLLDPVQSALRRRATRFLPHIVPGRRCSMPAGSSGAIPSLNPKPTVCDVILSGAGSRGPLAVGGGLRAAAGVAARGRVSISN